MIQKNNHEINLKLIRKNKYLIKRLMRQLGFRLERLDTLNGLEPLLYRHIQECDEFFFIQIGANDGVTFDPLYEFVRHNSAKVKGIVVEPVKDVFDELQHNYRKFPNIIPVNAAIHNSKREMTLHRVDPARKNELPLWTKGIASFDADFHKLSGTPSEFIIPEQVNCLSIPELIKIYDVQRIDLLQIDAEGYDFEILSSLDYNEIKPRIIHFEHGMRFGTMKKSDYTQLVDLLQKQGYYLMIEPDDTVAYLNDLQNN